MKQKQAIPENGSSFSPIHDAKDFIKLEEKEFYEYSLLLSRLRETNANENRLKAEIEMLNIKISLQQDAIKKEIERLTLLRQEFLDKIQQKYGVDILKYNIDEKTGVATSIKEREVN